MFQVMVRLRQPLVLQKVIVESGATLKIDSIEKDRSNSLTISVSSSLVSSSGEIALEAGTYVFNGDTWNKETE